jgi:hypothetical protein
MWCGGAKMKGGESWDKASAATVAAASLRPNSLIQSSKSPWHACHAHLHCDVGADKVGEGPCRRLLCARAAAGSCSCASPTCGAATRAHNANKQRHCLVGHRAEQVTQGVTNLQTGEGARQEGTWHSTAAKAVERRRSNSACIGKGKY